MFRTRSLLFLSLFHNPTQLTHTRPPLLHLPHPHNPLQSPPLLHSPRLLPMKPLRKLLIRLPLTHLMSILGPSLHINIKLERFKLFHLTSRFFEITLIVSPFTFSVAVFLWAGVARGGGLFVAATMGFLGEFAQTMLFEDVVSVGEVGGGEGAGCVLCEFAGFDEGGEGCGEAVRSDGI